MATHSAAQPTAVSGMTAAPAVMPSLVDYCPPWPPMPPWWPWPPIPPWPPWRDVFNEMAITRTAAAPESSAPVTPRSPEDFADGGTAAPVTTPSAPVISAQEQQMLKKLVKAMKQALADKESEDAKVAELANAALAEFSLFALGFLEGKGFIPAGTFIGSSQQPVNHHNKTDSIRQFVSILEALSIDPTRAAPVIAIAVTVSGSNIAVAGGAAAAAAGVLTGGLAVLVVGAAVYYLTQE